MIRADRRAVLKGAALVSVAPIVGGLSETSSRLIVFDSQVPESRAFVAGKSGRRFDLADAHATRLSALRSAAPGAGTIDGLTGWSDWVGLRGEFEARGFRLTREDCVAAPISAKAHLFRWTMQRR